jgi:hypothetical protein
VFDTVDARYKHEDSWLHVSVFTGFMICFKETTSVELKKGK